MNQNLAAFFSMVSHSEGTDQVADPYRCCFEFKHTIIDLSDHPVITGEWEGESLDFLGQKYAGEVSTAAGRYQIIERTWKTCKAVLKLPDFGPNSQDLAAEELIREADALEFVIAGDIPEAIAKCSHIWASLPGSESGQPQRRLADLVQVYRNVGGLLA